MTIDIFSSTGAKQKAMDLPATLFEAPVNWGLMHQAVTMQQANRRQSGAHVKTRGEVQGSTRKLYDQKHTGRARRGAVRSPLLRGGGKIFGPRNIRNFTQDMPQKMRHAALRSSLSLMASKGAIIAIESYPDSIKTKTLSDLLKKLPIEFGRRVLLVSPSAHKALQLSGRNIPAVTTVRAAYLNIEDVLNSKHIVFLVDAIAEAEKVFGKKEVIAKTSKVKKQTNQKNQRSETKKAPRKKVSSASKKVSKKSSDSSNSSSSSESK